MRDLPIDMNLRRRFLFRAMTCSLLLIFQTFFWGGDIGYAATSAAEMPGLILNGSRDRAQVALTFDLCQVPGRPAGFDEKIVSILEHQQLAATFFAGGDWMRTHPEAIRRLAENPKFEIGSHSWSHPDLRKLSAEQIGDEVGRTAAELKRLTGRTTSLFRLPFGYADQRTLQILHDLGQKVIQWDLVTADPDPLVSADKILAAVKKQSRKGSIIIMHANGRGHHTAEALPLVIEALSSKGFAFATVSDLLGEPAPDFPSFRTVP